jgi:hypothetical protein
MPSRHARVTAMMVGLSARMNLQTADGRCDKNRREGKARQRTTRRGELIADGFGPDRSGRTPCEWHVQTAIAVLR